MKAVVLETRKGEAAVLVNDGTVRIVRGAYNVGDIIDYRLRPRFVQWIAAAADGGSGLRECSDVDRPQLCDLCRGESGRESFHCLQPQ